jgi:hypothetical protein
MGLRKAYKAVSVKFIENADNKAEFVVLSISTKPINKRLALYHAKNGEIVAAVDYILTRDRREAYMQTGT